MGNRSKDQGRSPGGGRGSRSRNFVSVTLGLLRDRHVDSLRLHFGSPEEPLAKGEQGLDGILDIVESEAGELTPDKVYVSKGRIARYSRAGAYKGLSREKPPGRAVWVERWQVP